jgi:methylglutaconyl-CoA hydratase
MKTTYQTIKIEWQKEILKIFLNRPEKRNALNATMISELTDVFHTQRDNTLIRGVLLAAEGEAFCAGADLAYLQSLQDKSYADNYQDSVNLKNLYWSIYTFPKPTLAVVNGPAVAGGCGLMGVCDVVYASKEAIFGFPEVRIGFVAAVVSVFLLQTIGYRWVKQLLLSGETIPAIQALQIGLINRVLAQEGLFSAADQFFHQICQSSTTAITQTKQFLLQQSGKQLEKLLNEACEFNARARQSADFKEGLAAFLEKRKAVWQS